jgi:two-component system sensor histidine kinase DegS
MLGRRAGRLLSQARLEIPASQARHDPQLEQHLFRIVQQAGLNAVRHARARTLRIHGVVEADLIDLTVEDDGSGFEAGERLDIAGLLASRHFGLAGMLERAALIGAEAQIDSAPGRGTRGRVRWKADSRPANG